MTNQLALVLAILILGGLALDVVLFGSEHLVFLAKRFSDLIEWIAFWR